MNTKKDISNLIDQNTTEIVLESISDGVFTVDHEWKIMSFNKAAEKITGISRQKAIGSYCWNVFRSNMCQDQCALKKTMQEGKSYFSTSTDIINNKKKRIPITVSTSLLKNKNGNIVGGVEIFRDHSLVEELRKKLYDSFQMGDMISQSPSMKNIFRVLPKLSQSDSTILIRGETGTGKELMAKALHSQSQRKNAPFVAINCGALPDTLLESELFGYKAGAFTHAIKDKQGQFALANNGTILLDEIGDTSPAFQVKLLRVLEEKSFLPLGAITKEKSNVRIIAATNKNLSKMLEANEFRRDLYYRINVVQIKLPPLRERMEDLPLLVDHFIDSLNKIQKKSVCGINNKAMEILMGHNYPGNIRELENIIEHAFVLCSKGDITPEHLPPSLTRQSFFKIEEISSSTPFEAAEKKVIQAFLKKNNYNRNATAKDLGIHTTTLFRKMGRLGMKLPKIDGRFKQQ